MVDYFIHETACVDDGAQIGAGSKVWHFSHVMPGSNIGKNCSLGQNVYVASSVTIGNGCKIQNNVSLYDGVILEDDVFCGPSVVFTNVYNPRSNVSRKHEYKASHIKQGATLGANCTIVCGVTVYEYAFVGAGAVVKEDVKPYAIVVGVPSRQIGWMSRSGETLDLPLTGHSEALCSVANERYILKDDICFLANKAADA